MRRKQILGELKLDEFLRIFQENSADQFFVRLCGYVCVCVCVSFDTFPKTPPSPHPLETYLHSQLHPSNAVEFAIDVSSARK